MSAKLAALAVAILATALPGSSATAQSSPQFVAAGTTVLRAFQSGVVDMVVPDQAVFTSFDQNVVGVPSLKAVKQDGLVGVRIVRQGRPAGTDLEINAFAYPKSNAGEPSIGIAFRAREDRNAVDPIVCSECRLPAGTYRLYFLTQGTGPAEIEIQFKGLAGRTEHAAFAPLGATFSQSDGFAGASTDAGGFAATGTEARATSRGAVVQLDYFDTKDRAAAPGLAPGGVGDYGFCTYPDGKLPGAGVLPGCPGGMLGAPTFVGASITGGFGFAHIGSLSDAPAGPYAGGAYATHAGLPFRNAGTTIVTIPAS
ncbi:MAG: hypothetical protein JWO60_3441 [Frankiales bacterium]|nr:hypothetical protein [Frankiales bacterium]